ncbi:hypothetical protein CANCADRAFT_15178, partial [Tortispora caseinolytica NRRL Y-17796]
LPKFPLGKESKTTMTPDSYPSPRVGPNMTFAKLIVTLFKSPPNEPILLYKSEPQRLYFVILWCITITVTVYALNMTEMIEESAWTIYQKNENDLPFMHNLMQFVLRTGLNLGVLGIAAGFIYALMRARSRLVRTMHFVSRGSDDEPIIRISTNPRLPFNTKNQPIPVYDIPLSDLTFGKNAVAWTGNGFYGTADKASFFMMIHQKGVRFPFIVDRAGWFWGDGRVWDVIFGKKAVNEAEKGITYQKKWDIARQEREKNIEKKKLEVGNNWRSKEFLKLVKDDFETAKRFV